MQPSGRVLRVPSAWAGTARCRRNRTRSNHPASASPAHRIQGKPRRIGRHRWAWFRPSGAHTVDRSGLTQVLAAYRWVARRLSRPALPQRRRKSHSGSGFAQIGRGHGVIEYHARPFRLVRDFDLAHASHLLQGLLDDVRAGRARHVGHVEHHFTLRGRSRRGAERQCPLNASPISLIPCPLLVTPTAGGLSAAKPDRAPPTRRRSRAQPWQRTAGPARRNFQLGIRCAPVDAARGRRARSRRPILPAGTVDRD